MGDRRDAQAADDELVWGGGRLVAHEGVRAPWRGCGWTGLGGRSRWDPWRHEVGEGHRIEGAGDGIAHADPQQVDRAARRAVADRGVLGVVAGAQHRGDRAFERAQHLGHRDRGRRSGQLVAAVGAAGADHQARLAQADDQLLQVGAREILLGGDLGEGRRTGAEMAPELDHQADAVLALGAERDGAAAVERELLGSRRRVVEAVRERSSIPSDFVGIESTRAPLERQSRGAGR